MTEVLAVRVTEALERARRFLARAQLPSGELPVEATLYSAAGHPERTTLDSSPFATAFAALGLCVDDAPETRMVLARAATFVESQREWPGVWRFWGRGSPLPPDLDSTSVCRTLLAHHDRPQRSIDWLYRRNRDGTGRFRTWLTPGNIRTLHPVYWLLMIRELRPSRCYLVFRRTAAHRRDRDVVVNANIVTLLGDVPETHGAIAWILETIRAGAEEQRDKWYHAREALYLAIGRAYARGARRFGEVAETVAERVAERSTVQGEIPGDALRTAMGAAALLYFGRRDQAARAIAWLAESQESDGGWPAAPLHHGGPSRQSSWGSRAVTTALVIEALALYERHDA